MLNNELSISAFVLSPKIVLEQRGVFNDENDDGFAQVGETISYEFIVKNTGNTVLKNIALIDPKVSVLGDNIDSLQPNSIDKERFAGTYVITQDDINLGAFHNKTEVISYDIKNNQVVDVSQDVNGIEPIDSSCIDCSVVLLPQNETLSLIKKYAIEDTNLDGVTGNLNDKIIYYLDVVNKGNTTLFHASISDPMLDVANESVVPNVLQPAEIGQIALEYTIKQEDIDKGYVENIATAAAEVLSGNIHNTSDDITDVSDTGTNPTGEPISNPNSCLLYTSPSPRDKRQSRMPSSA